MIVQFMGQFEEARKSLLAQRLAKQQKEAQRAAKEIAANRDKAEVWRREKDQIGLSQTLFVFRLNERRSSLLRMRSLLSFKQRQIRKMRRPQLLERARQHCCSKSPQNSRNNLARDLRRCHKHTVGRERERERGAIDSVLI